MERITGKEGHGVKRKEEIKQTLKEEGEMWRKGKQEGKKEGRYKVLMRSCTEGS